MQNCLSLCFHIFHYYMLERVRVELRLHMYSDFLQYMQTNLSLYSRPLGYTIRAQSTHVSFFQDPLIRAFIKRPIGQCRPVTYLSPSASRLF